MSEYRTPSGARYSSPTSTSADAVSTLMWRAGGRAVVATSGDLMLGPGTRRPTRRDRVPISSSTRGDERKQQAVTSRRPFQERYVAEANAPSGGGRAIKAIATSARTCARSTSTGRHPLRTARLGVVDLRVRDRGSIVAAIGVLKRGARSTRISVWVRTNEPNRTRHKLDLISAENAVTIRRAAYASFRSDL